MQPFYNSFIHLLYLLVPEIRATGVSSSRSQQSLGEGRVTPWMSYQFIAGPQTHKSLLSHLHLKGQFTTSNHNHTYVFGRWNQTLAVRLHRQLLHYHVTPFYYLFHIAILASVPENQCVQRSFNHWMKHSGAGQ